MHDFNPENMAAMYRAMVREEIKTVGAQINVVGFLVSNDPASATYARYTAEGCEDVGIHFTLQHKTTEDITTAIHAANANPEVHGVFIYYPIFGDERDAKVKDLVDPKKDVGGLTTYWMEKLYRNERFDDEAAQHRAILPCTPLAIIKILEATEAYSPGGLPFRGQTMTVFNRSDVVGRPLAYMLSNDGGTVYSFDIDGGIVIGADQSTPAPIDRATALSRSDIVITGVPSSHFAKIRREELKPGAICLNFSFVKNFEESAREAARIYIPRVGPLTVAMCLRNACRLYRNYHHQ